MIIFTVLLVLIAGCVVVVVLSNKHKASDDFRMPKSKPRQEDVVCVESDVSASDLNFLSGASCAASRVFFGKVSSNADSNAASDSVSDAYRRRKEGN